MHSCACSGGSPRIPLSTSRILFGMVFVLWQPVGFVSGVAWAQERTGYKGRLCDSSAAVGLQCGKSRGTARATSGRCAHASKRRRAAWVRPRPGCTMLARIVAVSERRIDMPTWTPDPSFYPSPRQAAKAPPETLAYVAAFDPDRKSPDAIAVVDVDPASSSFGKIVNTTPVAHTGDEF